MTRSNFVWMDFAAHTPPYANRKARTRLTQLLVGKKTIENEILGEKVTQLHLRLM